MEETYEQRLKIPLLGDDNTEFKTQSGTLVARGYSRIVIGCRGPYIEFDNKHIDFFKISVPEDQKYRLGDNNVYYDEYRSEDDSNVKIYHQKKKVDYADYQIDKWYISPFELNANGQKVIVPLKEIKSMSSSSITIDTLINSRWEDGILTVETNSVDLIVTSPPYNVNLGKNKHKKDMYASYDDNMPYQDYLMWMTRLFFQCNRVLKDGGRLCINIGDGANGSIPTHVDFTNILINQMNKSYMYLPEGDEFLYPEVAEPWFQPFQMMTTIVWNKNQIGSSTAWGSWKSPSCPSFPTQFEFIIVVAKGTTKHDGDPKKISVSGEDFIRNSRALWEFLPETEMMKKYNHPAMFPEELPKRLIDQLTYEDDVVLDPFSGAGTTCAVAKRMKRHFIGIEMSKQYHQQAMERLSMTPSIEKVVIDGKEVDVPDWMVLK